MSSTSTIWPVETRSKRTSALTWTTSAPELELGGELERRVEALERADEGVDIDVADWNDRIA